MEAAAAAATVTNNPAAAINGRREGEVRRLHIIYFLSCIQHPHLIRVHHLNRNGGVFLRDVKRWMGELRGKGMPDSFSWSYKRRYKTGYVWQDLMDDDLITPISDNEYVLKGSQISVNFDACKQGTGTPSSSSSDGGGQFNQLLLRPRPNKQEAPDQHHLTTNEMTINSPTSPTTHTTSLNSASSSRYSSFQQYYRQEILESSQYLNIDNVVGLQETVPTGDQASSNAAASLSLHHTSQSPLRSRRSQQRRRHSNIPIASRMLRKLMTTCRVDVDTNDTALVVSNKSSNFPTLLSNQQSSTRPGETQSLSSATNHKVVKRLHSCNQQHDGTTSARDDYEGIKGSTKAQRQPVRFCRETDVCAAYRPVGAPTCMQCGKSFRPEKMHLHMTMSCKGTRPVKNYDTSSPENPPDHITQTCGSLVLAATSSLPQVFSN